MDVLGLRADVGALTHDRPLGVGHGVSFGVHVSAQQMLILRSRWRDTGIASGKWTWQALLHALPAATGLLSIAATMLPAPVALPVVVTLAGCARLPVSLTLRAPLTVPVTAVSRGALALPAGAPRRVARALSVRCRGGLSGCIARSLGALRVCERHCRHEPRAQRHREQDTAPHDTSISPIHERSALFTITRLSLRLSVR